MATGFIVDESQGRLRLKIEGGVVEEFDARDVVERREQALSAMPSDLYQIMTVDELVDLVEYLSTLRETGR